MEVAYTDDPSIVDDEELWRRIPEVWIVEDRVMGGVRIASAAFSDHRNGTPMSVFLGSVVRDDGRAPESVLMPSYYLAAVKAGAARDCGQGVRRAPLQDEPAHAEVFGKKTKSVKKRLAQAAYWVVGPDA